MEMTKCAQSIKDELALELAKVGSSIQEFEELLQSVNYGESVYKIAKIANDIINKKAGFSENVKIIPEFAFKGSVGAGALAGLSVDEMDKSVDLVHKALAREREKVKLVQRLTRNLKLEHGLS
jgi:hypothetical protein